MKRTRITAAADVLLRLADPAERDAREIDRAAAATPR